MCNMKAENNNIGSLYGCKCCLYFAFKKNELSFVEKNKIRKTKSRILPANRCSQRDGFVQHTFDVNSMS